MSEELQGTSAEMNNAWSQYLLLREQLHQTQASARREAEDVASLQRTLFSARQLNRDETTTVGARGVCEVQRRVEALEKALEQANQQYQQLCQQREECELASEEQYNEYVGWRIAVSQLTKKKMEVTLSTIQNVGVVRGDER